MLQDLGYSRFSLLPNFWQAPLSPLSMRITPWPLYLWPAQTWLNKESCSVILDLWYLIKSFILHLWCLLLARILGSQFSKNSHPLMSPLINTPFTDPLTLLLGYKCPLVFAVSGVEPNLSPHYRNRSIAVVLKSLPYHFNKSQDNFFFKYTLIVWKVLYSLVYLTKLHLFLNSNVILFFIFP